MANQAYLDQIRQSFVPGKFPGASPPPPSGGFSRAQLVQQAQASTALVKKGSGITRNDLFGAIRDAVGKTKNDTLGLGKKAAIAVGRPGADIATGQGGKLTHDVAQLSRDTGGAPNYLLNASIVNPAKQLMAHNKVAARNAEIKSRENLGLGDQGTKLGHALLKAGVLGGGTVVGAMSPGIVLRGGAKIFDRAKLPNIEPPTVPKSAITDKNRLLTSGNKALPAPGPQYAGTASRYMATKTTNARQTAGHNPGTLTQDIAPTAKSSQRPSSLSLKLNQIDEVLRQAQSGEINLSPQAQKELFQTRQGLSKGTPPTKQVTGAAPTATTKTSSVSKAAQFIKDYKNMDKGEGGFIQVGRTPKNIHPEDKAVMSDFIDHARGVYKPNTVQAHDLELQASRIAERHGITPKKGGDPIKQLANAFEQRLQTEKPSLASRLNPTKTEEGFVKLPRRAQQAAGEAKLRPVSSSTVSIPNEGKFKSLISTSGELSRQGQHGQEIANRLSKTESTSEIGQAEFLRKIPTVKGLNKGDHTAFVDALDKLDKGQITEDQLTGKVGQAVKEWSANIESVRNRGEAAGIKVGNLGKYYFPRNYSEMLANKKGLQSVAQHLVDTKQADNIGEAMQALQFMKRKYDNPFGHFENSRVFDLPGYDTSKNATLNYIQGAYNKIGHAEQFGAKGEKAMELIGNLGKEGYDSERALKNYQIGAGIKKYDQPGVEKFSKGIRAFQRTTKLGTSSILNATQSTNTAAVGGTFRTAKNALKTLGRQDRDYVEKTGTTIDTVINSLRQQTGFAATPKGFLSKVINAPGFGQVEKFNRGVAALTGRDWAMSLAKRGNARSIDILRNKLGVEGDIGRTLTEEQQIQASRKMVELTQFKTGGKDLPGWADSPMGKVATQFKTFQYKQTGFIYNELIKQALKGNIMPLVRFTAVGIPLGLASGKVRGALRGQAPTSLKGNQDNPGTSTQSQIYEALKGVGIEGLGSDASFLAQNVKSNRLTQYVASTLGGPTAGLAVQSTINAQKVATGASQPAKRQALQTVPVAGPYLANKFQPYQPTGKTQLTNLISQNSDVAKSIKQTGYIPSSPSKTQRNQVLTDVQYKAFVKDSAQRFMPKAQAALKDPQFQNLSAKDKKDTLSLQMTTARSEALDKLLGKSQRKQNSKLKKY